MAWGPEWPRQQLLARPPWEAERSRWFWISRPPQWILKRLQEAELWAPHQGLEAEGQVVGVRQVRRAQLAPWALPWPAGGLPEREVRAVVEPQQVG